MTTEYEAVTESEWKDLATTEITHLTDEEKDYLPRAWDEWIARVRRDAAREAEAERDEWRQTALDERGAALDALEQVKVRDARIKAVRDIHTPEKYSSRDGAICQECLHGDGYSVKYPCPTIRALDGDA